VATRKGAKHKALIRLRPREHDMNTERGLGNKDKACSSIDR
jgi:hypothetical protein